MRLPRFSQHCLQHSQVITSSTLSTRKVAGMYYFFYKIIYKGYQIQWVVLPAILQLLLILNETFSKLWTILTIVNHNNIIMDTLIFHIYTCYSQHVESETAPIGTRVKLS